MTVVDDGTGGGIYFLDAPGGTGKTFVISLILAAIWPKNEIALHSLELLPLCWKAVELHIRL